MRTKTLLLTAALGVAGVASSMAQVYSVNAVGYVNLTIPKGFSIVANPLNASANTISALFASAPDGTTIYKYNNATGKYAINSFSFGQWDNASDTLTPGQGAFISVLSTYTNTFVGEVMQGSLTNAIAKGFSIISSQVPQTGKLSTDLGYAAKEGDTVYKFSNATSKYVQSNFSFGSWDTEPTINVGEGFFISTTAATVWTRTFSTQQ